MDALATIVPRPKCIAVALLRAVESRKGTAVLLQRPAVVAAHSNATPDRLGLLWQEGQQPAKRAHDPVTHIPEGQRSGRAEQAVSATY